jgi:cytochrome oxidase Cu insertion factor (SCO1/SenC/PrrC family)
MKLIQTILLLIASSTIFANSNYHFKLDIQYQFTFQVDSIWLEYESFLPGSPINAIKATQKQKGLVTFSGALPAPAVSAILKCKSLGQLYYKYFVLDSGGYQIKATNTARMLKFVGYNSINEQLFAKQILINGSKNSLVLKIDQILQLIHKYPQQFYSLVLLNQVFAQQMIITPQKILDEWNKLDKSLQSSEMGQWLHTKILAANRLSKGNLFPSFSFPTASGTEFNSSNMKGTNYLVIFGATWCGPCKQNLMKLRPLLNKLDTTRLRVLHITVSSKKAEWEKMINTYALHNWTNVLDTSSNKIENLLQQFGITFIPFYLLVDKNYVIQYNSYQENDGDLKKLQQRLANF